MFSFLKIGTSTEKLVRLNDQSNFSEYCILDADCEDLSITVKRDDALAKNTFEIQNHIYLARTEVHLLRHSFTSHSNIDKTKRKLTTIFSHVIKVNEND